MDTGDEWKSVEKLQDNHLINNAVVIMTSDWNNTSFPHEIPKGSPWSEDDRLALNKDIAAQMDKMQFLHQLGFLFNFWNMFQNMVCLLEF